jgi:hypothetical protein
VFTISYEGTFITKIVSIIRYIDTQVTSSSEIRSDVDIQVRSGVVPGINVQVVRINRWLNYESVGLYHKYTGIWYAHTVTHSDVSIQFQA